jgi:hypothetical protein
MKLLAALAVGYWVGAKTGRRDLNQLTTSLKALYDTDEFADVVTAARVQVGATLRDLAAIVDGDQKVADVSGDLVAKVRHLVGSE